MPVTPIAQLLLPEDVRLDLEVTGKASLLEEIGRHMARRHGLNPQWVMQGLARREQVGSTGVGEGVAIPHARVRGLDHIVAAYLRLAAPIPFGAADGRPVGHVIALLVPKEAAAEHLEVLAAVSRLFADGRFRARLEACGDAGQVTALVAGWQGEE